MHAQRIAYGSIVGSSFSSSGDSWSFSSSSDLDNSGSDEEVSVSIDEIEDALYPLIRPQKQRRRSRLLVPKLTQMDLRRHFATMWVNVLNSHDVNLLQSFAERYISPAAFLRKSIPKDANPAQYLRSQTKGTLVVKPKLLHIAGLAALLNYWRALMELLPDQTIALTGTRVLRRPDEADGKGCRIAMDMQYSMTQVYESSNSMLAACGLDFAEQEDARRRGTTYVPKPDHLQSLGNDLGAEPATKKRRVADADVVYVSAEQGARNNSVTLLSEADIDHGMAISHDSHMHRRVEHGPVYLRLLPRPLSIDLALTLTITVDSRRQIVAFDYSPPVVSV